MRQKKFQNVKALAALLMATALMANCSSSSKSTGLQVEDDKDSAASYDESFDPLSLEDPEFEIPRRGSQESSRTVESQQLPSRSEPVALDTSLVTVPGFRVQILQTEDGEKARELLTQATIELDAEVEISFEAPYYKVRAGKFLNRYDAELLQGRAAEKGYHTAWIVRTPIKIRAHEISNEH